jgi:hypothetical protein
VDQDMKSMMENFKPGEPISFSATLQLKNNDTNVDGVVADVSAEVVGKVNKAQAEGEDAQAVVEAQFEQDK